MLASGDGKASCLSLYNGTGVARLSPRPAPKLYSRRRSSCLVALAALIAATLTGGCSYQLSSLNAKGDDDAIETGSIAHPAAYAEPDLRPPEIDLAYARAAAAEALARGGKDASTPWENPHTGAGGNITPLATTTHNEGSFICRDFLASYVRGETQSWLQGEACRTNHGKWEVKSLVPLKHS